MSFILLEAQLALANVLDQRRRSIILSTALALVTAVFVVLDSAAYGVRQKIIETTTTLTSGHVNVGGLYKLSAGYVSPVMRESEPVIKVVRQVVPQAVEVAKRTRGWGQVVSDSASISTSLVGIDIESESRLRSRLVAVDGELSALAHPRTIALFEHQAERLGVGVGDVVTISAETLSAMRNAVDARVVVICKDVGLLSNWIMFVSSATLHELLQSRAQTTGVVQIQLQEAQSSTVLDGIADALRGALRGAGYEVMDGPGQPFWMRMDAAGREQWVGQRLDVTTWEDEAQHLLGAVTTLQTLNRVLVTLLMLLIITGITNTMWVAIRERTRELGTLRALGVEPRGVVRVVMMESLVLALLGGVVGVGMGTAMSAGLDVVGVGVPAGWELFLLTDTLHLAFRPKMVGEALLVVVGTTTVAAILPAWRASKLRPLLAMAHR